GGLTKGSPWCTPPHQTTRGPVARHLRSQNRSRTARRETPRRALLEDVLLHKGSAPSNAAAAESRAAFPSRSGHGERSPGNPARGANQPTHLPSESATG